MTAGLRNVVILGGSYVGLATGKELAPVLPSTHRVVLIEPHSHFHHLFAFPRFAVFPGHEHKAFIPFTGVFADTPEPHRHIFVKAKAQSIQTDRVVLDREWNGMRDIPFDYLVIATGTKRQPPSEMAENEKVESVAYLQELQHRVQKAGSILMVGGGAVGVQMATDLKELYPEKIISLVHSRYQLMPTFHEKMDAIIKERFKELGVKLYLGSRVVGPLEGQGDRSTIQLANGSKLEADLVIPAIGQTPNTEFLSTLSTLPTNNLLNPRSGYVLVDKTLRLKHPGCDHMFAVGDIADSGSHKSARSGVGHAQVVAKNILTLLEGGLATQETIVTPPGIHLTLGLTKSIIFRNPNPKEGRTEPVVTYKDDGHADMSINDVWTRRGVAVTREEDYHL